MVHLEVLQSTGALYLLTNRFGTLQVRGIITTFITINCNSQLKSKYKWNNISGFYFKVFIFNKLHITYHSFPDMTILGPVLGSACKRLKLNPGKQTSQSGHSTYRCAASICISVLRWEVQTLEERTTKPHCNLSTLSLKKSVYRTGLLSNYEM